MDDGEERRVRARVMSEFGAGHAGGWVSAIEEAERRCIKVWHNNEFVYAVPWTELVQIRQLVAAAQRVREQES